MIPKVFHRIWLGPKPMPTEFRLFGQGWLARNLGWEMKLWTEENLPPSLFPDLLKKCLYYKSRANIYRYEILLREGGVYLDCDFEALKPIGPLLAGRDACVALQRDDVTHGSHVSNGFLAVEPNHPFMKALVDGLPEAFNVSDFYTMGPSHVTKVLKNFPRVTKFARSVFYPYGWTELGKKGADYGDSFAAHHWDSVRNPPVPIKETVQS